MSVVPNVNSLRTGPDERGLFGIYGGRFVAETLMPLILQLEQAYKDAKADPTFQSELDSFLEHYVGRPSPLYFAERLTEHLGGAKIPGVHVRRCGDDHRRGDAVEPDRDHLFCRGGAGRHVAAADKDAAGPVRAGCDAEPRHGLLRRRADRARGYLGVRPGLGHRGSFNASIATANSAALAAPASPMANVATGMPFGICTMDNNESSPPRDFDCTGTPSTGRLVLAAVMPGR